MPNHSILNAHDPSDYYPFGLMMSGRSWSEGYRYGFNGKELDAEGMGGYGSTYDYGFRIYNPAIAKFLSVDPLTASYPWYTPYQFAGNKPIIAIDLDGLEEYIIVDKSTQNGRVLTLKYAYNDNGLINNRWVINGIAYEQTKIFIAKIDDAGNEQISTFENLADMPAEYQSLMEEPISDTHKGTFISGGKNSGNKTAHNSAVMVTTIMVVDDNVVTENRQQMPKPSLNIQFKGGNNEYSNKLEAQKQLLNVVDYLNENPDKNILIIGHTGTTGGNDLEGNTPEVLAQRNDNQDFPTTRDLMLGRARAVRSTLIEMGIDGDRIQVGTGTHRNSDSNRRIGFVIK